ncbi:coiled-coil domain-containing protein 137 [Biomphalaria pfeifferi]|uniref:Coiled-coil domain-containing protein 137 n=1 Tax=Biomphalaria pfeifferi TaxID=112525 RepID=A0AAD8FAE8_BIOPF|nr:coiled-coil domain-containing protein 137 [Biomphalaria pfeifferi]
MGKLAKPQRSNKQKKIKAVDPFYHGSRKESLTQGLNQKPKQLEQEVPKKLKYLGFSIEGVQAGKVGKKSVIKFQHHPDGPRQYTKIFNTPLGTKPDKKQGKTNGQECPPKKPAVIQKGKLKVTEEAYHNYIDNLGPRRPYKENFSFEKAPDESYSDFRRRVEEETKSVLLKSEIDNQFDVSDEKQMLMNMKKKGMSDKKKQRLKEKKEMKSAALKEKKMEKKIEFAALQDKVEFGDIVHAPPVLSVRPKKAQVMDTDRPGLRMPELKAIFEGTKTVDSLKPTPSSSKALRPERKVGKTVKRKSMTVIQKAIADSQRESAIQAYRLLKNIKT